MFKSLLYRLNHINPSKPKTNYLKLAKTLVAIFILISITLKIIPTLAQEANITDQVHEAKQAGINAEGWNENQFVTTAVNICDATIGLCPTEQNIQESITLNGRYVPGGMIASTSNLIAQTYNQPASGIQYLAQLKDNLLGVKPAYAQGIGFEGLEPLLPIWRGFRNIVYLLSTVFFVVLGIMVMFRLKINPQTVLTVQNAVPQVITTLLLVTFSYAIAGLLIDLTYFVQNVVLVLLFQVQGKNLSQNLFPGTMPNVFGLGQYNFKNLSDAALGDIFRLTSMALPSFMIFILSSVLGLLVGTIFSVATMNPAAAIIGTQAGAAGGIIIIIIINIIILISLIKFFIGLIKAYVNIIFKIILAPLEIGAGAIPGMKIGFGSWANNLFANLLIFPICLLFLVLANIIIEKTSSTSGLWAPTMVKYNLPGTLASLAGGLGGGLIPMAVGFITIILMAKLPEIIPQVFFAIKPSGLQQAIGQSGPNVFGFVNTIGAVGKSSTAIAETAKYWANWKDQLPKKTSGDNSKAETSRYKNSKTPQKETPSGPAKSPDSPF